MAGEPPRPDPSTGTSPVCRNVVLRLEEGLHVRPCSLIAKVASEATTPVTLQSGDVGADASSMFDLIAMGLEVGSEIAICGDSAAQPAIDAIADLFETNFGDE